MTDQTPVETALEKLVVEYHEAGDALAEGQLKSDQLKAGLKNVLASMMTALEKSRPGEKLSEAKLDRLVRARPEWVEYEEGVWISKYETAKLSNRVDALGKLYDIRRSIYVSHREHAKMAQSFT